MARRHKYSARPTEVDGIRFDSKAEARRYTELRTLEKAGEISHLELQAALRHHCQWYQMRVLQG